MVNSTDCATPAELRPHEELLVLRAGDWRFLVPLRHVERVHPAALPAVVPSTDRGAPPVVALGAARVPVVFGEALLGATEARLAPEHKMLLLCDRRRRALLWVDAVEDVVAHSPVEGPARPGEDMVVGWSGEERALAVLDVPRLLDVAVGPVRQASGRGT